jgi:hypothetical protein
LILFLAASCQNPIPQQQSASSGSAASIVLMVVSFSIAATHTLRKEQTIDHAWHSLHSCMTEQKHPAAHSIMTILITFHDGYNYETYMAQCICEWFCFHQSARRNVLVKMKRTSHHMPFGTRYILPFPQ